MKKLIKILTLILIIVLTVFVSILIYKNMTESTNYYTYGTKDIKLFKSRL